MVTKLDRLGRSLAHLIELSATLQERARGRTGGQKPKLGPRQAHLAPLMYEETDPDGKRRYTVNQIAAEFGVTRPTIYRHLGRQTPDQTN